MKSQPIFTKKDSTRWVRTDLAAELETKKEGLEGVSTHTHNDGVLRVTVTEIISEQAAQQLRKPCGRYVMLEAEHLWQRPEGELVQICKSLERCLRHFVDRLAPRAKTVLCIGLGNREIAPDALGPLAVSQLTVTRHLESGAPELFSAVGGLSVCAVCPGVIGQTGIETLEQVKGTVEHVHPDLVILIDALAARSANRLASSIQCSDSGLQPGSGVGNRRLAINAQTLGVPVLVVGVPTITDSSTLIYDTLEQANVTQISPQLRTILDNNKSFFVTIKNSDRAVAVLAKLIAQAINNLFLPALSE